MDQFLWLPSTLPTPQGQCRKKNPEDNAKSGGVILLGGDAMRFGEWGNLNYYRPCPKIIEYLNKVATNSLKVSSLGNIVKCHCSRDRNFPSTSLKNTNPCAIGQGVAEERIDLCITVIKG